MPEGINAAVARWAGEAMGLPCSYGEFPGPPPCAMVKASPCDPVVYRYRTGGGVFRYAYEVYLLVPACSEGDRTSGVDTLQAACSAAAAGLCPDLDGVAWTSHDVRTAPCLFSELPGSGTVYQATLQLGYLISD